jgi:nucleoside-diphosphate-sugar epimerase
LFEKIEWIQADITEVPSLETAFANVDSVYHCAALISFDPKDEALLRKTNIEGTANIVNFSIANGIKKLCYVSSIAALGDLKEHEIRISEATDWNPEKPHSDYAMSKYGAEMEIWRGQQEGLKVAVLNPGIILGPGFWNKGSGALFSAVANGLPFYTRGFTGFVAVSDVVALLIMAMEKMEENENNNGQRFVVIEDNYSYETILNTIADTFKVKKPKFHASKYITEIAWRLNWITSTLFNQKRKISKDSARSSHRNSLYSNEKAKAVFGFQFKNTTDYITEIVALQSETII